MEREREIDLSLIIDFYITTLTLYERKLSHQAEMKSEIGHRALIRDTTLWEGKKKKVSFSEAGSSLTCLCT